jgi:capsular exopolysaccharide synthesis family protein
MTDQDLLADAREYLAMLHKRRALVSTCVGVALLLATLYNYTTRPVYQASCQVLIDRDTPNVLPTREVVSIDKSPDYYETQYELLRGRALAEKVVERLELQKNPELQLGALVSPWERLRSLLPATGSPRPADGLPLSGTVAAFRSRLTVEPVVNSRLVNLRFRAYDPVLAARVVNTLAQLYIEQFLEFRYTTSAEATGWLADRVQEQQNKVQAAEKSLQQYREAEGLLNVEERQSLVDQKLSTLSAAVMSARTERIAKEAVYRQMRALPASQLGTAPQVMDSTVIQGLKARLTELRDEEGRLAESLGDRHPDLQRVRGRIKALEERIDAETQSVLASVESSYRAAQDQEASLQRDLEAAKRDVMAVNRKAVEYGTLKRDVDGHRQLLQELASRNKETSLETELRTTSLRVVERAEVPRSPVLPRRLWNFEMAVLLGLGLGVGLSILFEHMDNTVKTPEDVKVELKLPFLGMIPEVPATEAAPSDEAPAPLVMRDPKSAVAEGYRVLRTNLIFSSAESSGRVLMISSANPGEGKTTTVANLATSLAENGARVLAVDADLRRPTIHQHFGLAKSPGLSDLIVGKVPPTQVIQGTRLPRLSVLPCGYIPPNPSELLGSESMRDIIATLRKRYDWVLIDAPPILAMADTPVLCPFVDGVVLVVWAETCTRPAVERAVDQVVRVGGKITGVVLNKVNLGRNSYYYSQHYGEYYRSYYAEQAAPESSAAGGRKA